MTVTVVRLPTLWRRNRLSPELTGVDGSSCPQPTLSSTSLVTISGRGRPLAQEHFYKYRSGRQRPTSGKPRTVPLDARPAHTVAEGRHCNLCETREPQ